MGDHFSLLVDRLLTESTLEAAIESNYFLQQSVQSSSQDTMVSSFNINLDSRLSPNPCKIVQCRICHDEDAQSNMETPCSCRGSLKYAHRECVQRWCNEKGDTSCEICFQQFMPDYTAPPPLFHYGSIPMNFRGNWDISRRDLLHPQFIPMASTDYSYLNPDLDDEFSASSTRSLICCRLVAIIFTVLLVLRHILPIIISRGEYSFTLSTVRFLVLRSIVILSLILIMVRAFTAAIQHRRQRRQGPHLPLTVIATAAENELGHPQSRLIHVR